MKTPLNRLSATRLSRMIAGHEVTCEAVTHSFIDAIKEREPAVRAFAWFDPARALATAREHDIVDWRGPLHGMPVAVKDNIDTADIPSEYGSAIYAGHVPHADAASVAALRSGGGYVLGKTVSAELANFTPGPTRNPHGLEHTPGGSSSGSAAAVASHMVPFATGTQTAGSVIRPASFCGVVGFVPTRGLVPRAGVKAVSDTLDVIGVFARSVEDAALIAAAVALKPEFQHAPAKAGPVSIGWTATPWASQLAPSMLAALERVARLLASRNPRVREISWPYDPNSNGDSFAGLADAQKTVQVFETARALGAELQYRSDLVSAKLADLIDEGRRSARTPTWRRSRRDATARPRSTRCSATPTCCSRPARPARRRTASAAPATRCSIARGTCSECRRSTCRCRARSRTASRGSRSACR